MPELIFAEVELDRLADVLADRVAARLAGPRATAAAYTVATLAAELGRSERSIRAEIRNGALAAVKRGRGYVISRDAVVDWAHGETRSMNERARSSRPRRRRSGPGPMRRALTREQA